MIKKITTIICIGLLVCSCASSKSQISDRSTKLRNYPKIFLTIVTPTTNAISLDNANMHSTNSKNNHTNGGSLSTGHIMEGDEQILMAAQDLEFSLREMGFESVDSQEKADVIAIFSIGTVRNEPPFGWVADKAILQFKDPKSGSIFYSAKADKKFLMVASVNAIVARLAKEVKRNY